MYNYDILEITRLSIITSNTSSDLCEHTPIVGRNTAKFLLNGKGKKWHQRKSCIGAKRATYLRRAEPNDLAHCKKLELASRIFIFVSLLMLRKCICVFTAHP